MRSAVLVEPDDDDAQVLENALTAHGFTVVRFPHALAALNYLDRVRRPIALLASAIDMPAAQPNGISLAMMMMRRFTGLKVLLATANLDLYLREHKTWHVLLKPLHTGVVHAAIATALVAVNPSKAR